MSEGQQIISEEEYILSGCSQYVDFITALLGPNGLHVAVAHTQTFHRLW